MANNGLIQSQSNQDQQLKYAQKKYAAIDPDEGESVPDTMASTNDMNSDWKSAYAAQNNLTADSQGIKGTDKPIDVVPEYDAQGKRSWRIIHSP